LIFIHDLDGASQAREVVDVTNLFSFLQRNFLFADSGVSYEQGNFSFPTLLLESEQFILVIVDVLLVNDDAENVLADVVDFLGSDLLFVFSFHLGRIFPFRFQRVSLVPSISGSVVRIDLVVVRQLVTVHDDARSEIGECMRSVS